MMFSAVARHMPKLLNRSRACRGNSFTPETLVWTEFGLFPIDEVDVGTHVLALNQETGREGWYSVEAQVVGHREYQIVTLTMANGEVVEAIVNHPFYVEAEDARRSSKSSADNDEHYESHHWINAGLIRAGDHLRLRNDANLEVAKAATRTERRRVQNLSVSQARTFFVGNSGILTHNSCQFVSMSRGTVSSMRSGTQTAVKEVDMSIDFAMHTDYDIFLPREPVGSTVKSVDAFITTTKQGLELKRLDSATANAVNGAFSKAVKRGSSPPAQVVYIDGMTAGLTREIFEEGVAKRRRSSDDPFHKIEEVFVRFGDGKIEQRYIQ